MQIPLVMSVWDDGYGISVPRKYQTTKGSISDALAGMQRTDSKAGYEIFVTRVGIILIFAKLMKKRLNSQEMSTPQF